MTNPRRRVQNSEVGMFGQMNTVFRFCRDEVVHNTVCAALRRDMEAMELRHQHALRAWSRERGLLRQRIAALKRRVSDAQRFEVKLDHLCQRLEPSDELELALRLSQTEIERLRFEYRALAATYAQLRSVVANAKSVDDLAWVEV